MTRHTTAAILGTAVTAILAAVPCFAQTQTDKSSKGLATPAAISISKSTLAMNLGVFKPAPETATAKSTTRPAQSNLSLSMFTERDQFTAGASDRFVTPHMTLFASEVYDGKRRFNADDDVQTSHPRITFVPSRGPEAPGVKNW